MNIAIFGGGGFIGTMLSKSLKDLGYKITVFDAFWFGNYLREDISFIETDLFDIKKEQLQGFDQAIFLGGVSNDPMAEFSPGDNFIQNAALPAYLAYVSKNCGIKRFIYASSCSVYGYTIDKFYDEDAPTISSYPYGISKLQGEKAVYGMADSGFSVISLRQGTVCGYSSRMRFDLVINTMYKSAMTEGVVRVSNPAIWRPILDISDSINGFTRAVQANYAISGIYNLFTSNFTLGQLGEMVRNAVQNSSRKTIDLEILDTIDFRNYKVLGEKIKTELGFIPSGSIDSIISGIHDHSSEYDFEDPKYYNIKVFSSRFKK